MHVSHKDANQISTARLQKNLDLPTKRKKREKKDLDPFMETRMG
jgi:hypothetical protein